MNISPCCNGLIRVLNDCTQYCEVDDTDDFRECLEDISSGASVGTLCTSADDDQSENDTNGGGKQAH